MILELVLFGFLVAILLVGFDRVVGRVTHAQSRIEDRIDAIENTVRRIGDLRAINNREVERGESGDGPMSLGRATQEINAILAKLEEDTESVINSVTLDTFMYLDSPKPVKNIRIDARAATSTWNC